LKGAVIVGFISITSLGRGFDGFGVFVIAVSP
jgi:hypothetical protein